MSNPTMNLGRVQPFLEVNLIKGVTYDNGDVVLWGRHKLSETRHGEGQVLALLTGKLGSPT